MKWIIPYLCYIFALMKNFFKSHKKTGISLLAVFLAAVSVIVTLAVKAPNVQKKQPQKDVVSEVTEPSSSKTSVNSSSSQAEPVKEPEPESSSKPESAVSVVSEPEPQKPKFKYNNNLDPDNNVFLDALEYTGYNLTKHRNDGLMWVYILCNDKPARGWLSGITYGGGSSGYETNADGTPNLEKFKRGGLVCASYATYVYFNYLPHIGGIDTSFLPRPNRSDSANDWYLAGKKWVEAGYSQYINYTAKESGTRTVFTPETDIPLGSLMLFSDFKNRNGYCTHICLYAGYKNGYHWVTHVGNANGPEFCAMERMSCGPDPQWPLAVISTPKNLGLFNVTDN